MTILPGNLKGVVPQPGDFCEFTLKKNKDRGFKAVDLVFQNSQCFCDETAYYVVFVFV